MKIAPPNLHSLVLSWPADAAAVSKFVTQDLYILCIGTYTIDLKEMLYIFFNLKKKWIAIIIWYNS